MLTIIIATLFFVLTQANGPYHHIVIQIFDNEDTLVSPILTVNEGANLTLNCRTLHLIHHPGGTYYDEDIIWSRAQNWRLQKMYQKSIQNIQKKAKLEFGSVTVEDQGRYICTSLKYHTSRILYIIVKSKNQTEQYSRRKRGLTGTPIENVLANRETPKTNLYDNNSIFPLMFTKGSFNLRPHAMFIMIALFLICLMVLFAFVIKLCSKCKMSENRNIMQQSKMYVVSMDSLPYTSLYKNL